MGFGQQIYQTYHKNIIRLRRLGSNRTPECGSRVNIRGVEVQQNTYLPVNCEQKKRSPLWITRQLS